MMLTPGAIAAVSEVLEAEGREFYRESTRSTAPRSRCTPRASQSTRSPWSTSSTSGATSNRSAARCASTSLAALVPASANARHYASIVREAATLRGLIRAGGEISRLGWERPGDATELVDQAEQIVFDLSQQRASAEFSHIEQLLKESFERITALYESGADVTGVLSGFRDLDRITLGFQPGNLIILAARPRWGSRRSASARAPTSRSGIRHRWLSSRSRCRSRR